MKTILKLVIIFCFFQMQAQVGINTTTPGAQLEIKSSNQATPANNDESLFLKWMPFLQRIRLRPNKA